MNKENNFQVERHLNNHAKMVVINTTDYSEARMLFFEECGIFEEYSVNEPLNKYTTVKIVLKKNGKVFEEHLRHFPIGSSEV